MKNLVRLLPLLACLLPVMCFSETLSLQKALNAKVVRVTVRSLGGHSGHCAELVIQSLSTQHVQLEIEAGRRLNSLNDAEQDLLIVKSQTLELHGGATRRVEVKAYCCQAEKRSPAKHSAYDVHAMADMPLYLLARYLNANSFDADVEQKAVWAISNQRSAATVAGAQDSAIKPLREMVASIKGEVLPWYTLYTKSKALSDGSIETVALELRGELVYSNDRVCYMTLNVLNEQDMPVCFERGEWLQTCVNERYKVAVPVAGLPSGRYRVQMRSNDRIIAQEFFEI